MTDKQRERIRKLGLHEEDFAPKEEKQLTVVEITREDFDLLDVEQEVTYHIYEEDGTMTIKRGVNR